MPLAPPVPDRVTLDNDESHHLKNVLRIGLAEPVELFDTESNRAFRGTVESFSGARVTIALDEEIPGSRAPAIHLLCGLVKAERCDLIVEKCTEIGVRSIRFFAAERSQYSIPSEGGKLGRWEKITRSALKQCYGQALPALSVSPSLTAMLSRFSESPPETELRLLLAPPGPADEAAPSATGDHFHAAHQPSGIVDLFQSGSASSGPGSRSLQNLQKMADSYIIVGPEGGLTESEVALARRFHFIPCALGTNVLRTETAAILACGILRALLR